MVAYRGLDFGATRNFHLTNNNSFIGVSDNGIPIHPAFHLSCYALLRAKSMTKPGRRVSGPRGNTAVLL